MNYSLNTLFIPLDFFIVIGIILSIVILKQTGRIDRPLWKLFWIGALLGLSWELGFNLQMIFCGQPAATFLNPLPVHFPFIVASHSI